MNKPKINTITGNKESRLDKLDKKASDKVIESGNHYKVDKLSQDKLFKTGESDHLGNFYKPTETSYFDPYEDYVDKGTLRGGTFSSSQLNTIRANNQSRLEQSGHAIQRVATNILPQIISGAASMLDFKGYVDAEHAAQNKIVNWAQDLKKENDEKYAIYEENPGESMQMGDWAWWMGRGSGLVESIGSFLALGAGVGKVVPLVLRAARAKNLVTAITKSAKLGGQFADGTAGLITATMLNQAEAVMEATEVYNTTYENSAGKGFGEKEARERAAKAASTTMNLNRINILLNLSSAKAFISPRKYARQIIKNPSLLKTLKDVGFEGGQEAMEELINHVASKAGLAEGEKKDYTFNDAMADMGTMEGFEAAFLGALGGIAQTGGTKALGYSKFGLNSTKDADGNRISYVTGQKNRYAEQQEAIEDLKKQGVNVTDAMKSVADQMAFEERLKAAQEEGDPDKIKNIENEMFESQAYKAFSTGTTEVLENLLIAETQKEVKSREDQEHVDNAKKAIEDLKGLEAIYENYEELENVNEVFRNRANRIRTERIVKRAEAEKILSDTELSNSVNKIAKKYKFKNNRDVKITKDGKETTETFVDESPLTYNMTDLEVNPHQEGSQNKAIYDKFLKEVQKTPEYQQSMKHAAREEGNNAAMEKIEKDFTKLTSKKYQAEVKKRKKKQAFVKASYEKLKESESETEILALIKASDDKAFTKRAYAKIAEIREKNKLKKAQSEKDKIETDYARKINNAKDDEALDKLLKNIPNNISQKKKDNLKDKIKVRRNNLQRILNGESIEETENPLNLFESGNPNEKNQKKGTPLPKEIPNKNNESTDVEKEIIDSLDTLKEGDKTLLIGEDSKGNLIWDFERSKKGNNRLAYSSREFEQNEEGGIVTRNENTNEVGNLHLLDPTKFLKGTKIVLRVDHQYGTNPDLNDGMVYDPASVNKDKVLWLDRVDELKNLHGESAYTLSAEYKAEVPIIIETPSGEFVGYLHDTQWISEENINNTAEEIKKDRDFLYKIREIVIAKKKGVNTKIDFKSFGRLLKNKDGAISVSEAMPDINLVLAIGKDGKYNFLKDTPEADRGGEENKIINNENPQDGRLYAIVQIGPTQRIAIALERTSLQKEVISSVLKAVEIYMTNDTENPLVDKIIATKLGVDITTREGIKTYLEQFLYLVQTDKKKTLKSMIMDGMSNESNVPLITVTGNGIEFGRPTVNMNNRGEKEHPQARVAAISPDWNENNPEWNTTGLTKLKSHLKEMLSNADMTSLTTGTPAVLINEDGEIISKSYRDYLKSAYKTKLLSTNIGTDENPNWTYTIQPTITFDTSFAEGTKTGTSGRPAPPAHTKAVKESIKKSKKTKKAVVETDNSKLIIAEIEANRKKEIAPLLEKLNILKEELKNIREDFDANNNPSGLIQKDVVKEREAQKIIDFLSKRHGIHASLADMGPYSSYGEFNRDTLEIKINRETTLNEQGYAGVDNTNNIPRGTIFHEFIHPFVEILEDQNPELYDEIYKKAVKANKTKPFTDSLEHYSKERQKEELVVRYLDNLSKNEKIPNLIQKFLNWISEFFHSKRKNNKANLKTLSLNTTVEELYDVFKNYGNLKEEVSKVIKQDNIKNELEFLNKMIAMPEVTKEGVKYYQDRIELLTSQVIREDISSKQQILKKIKKLEAKIAKINTKFDLLVKAQQPAQQTSGVETYKGLKVINSLDITNQEGQKGAAQYDKLNNLVKVNRELLKTKFKEKAWTNMRELVETIHGEQVKSKAENLPANSFNTYEEFERFVIEHEYQHSLYSRKDFNKEFPGGTKGEYETAINNRALDSLAQPTSEVEVKKADIERRREASRLGAKLLIDKKELVKVTNQTGTKSTKEGIGKIVTFLNNTFADTYKLIEYDGKDLTLSRNGTEFKIPFTGVTLGGGSTRVYDFNINDIIDAKYDAELAALETQPVSEVDPEADVIDDISLEQKAKSLSSNPSITIAQMEETIASFKLEVPPNMTPEDVEEAISVFELAIKLKKDTISTTLASGQITTSSAAENDVELSEEDQREIDELNNEEDDEEYSIPSYMDKDFSEDQTEEERKEQVERIRAQRKALNQNLIVGLDPATQQSTITYLSSIIINKELAAKTKGKLNIKKIIREELESLASGADFIERQGLVNRANVIRSLSKRSQVNKISRLVNQHLSLLSVGTVKESESSEQDASGLGDVIHTDEWKYTIDSKNTASAEFRKFFSAIYAVDENGPINNSIGLPETIPFDEIYNELHRILANKPADFKLMIDTLRIHSDNKPWLNPVIEKLEAAESKIKNEFTSDMAKHNINMSFVMWSQDKNGNYFIENWSSNSSSTEQKLKEVWRSNFKGNVTNSNLVTLNEEKDYIYNKEVSKQLIEQSNNWKNNPKGISNEDLAIWLGNFGIIIADQTYDDLRNNKFKNKGVRKNWEQLFTNSDGLVRALATELKNATMGETQSVIDTSSSAFILNDTVVKILATLDSVNTKIANNNSFQSGTKTIYSYGNNNALINRMRDLTSYNDDGTFVNDELINKLKSISFSKDSIWLDDITDKNSMELARSQFSVGYLSLEALKRQNTKSKDNRKLNNLTAAEHEVTKLGKFFNNSKTIINGEHRRKVSYFYPTMSDKTTMLTIQALSKQLILENGEMSTENLNTLYDALVQPEINRIIAKTKADNIKGYETDYFYFFESLNFLELTYNKKEKTYREHIIDGVSAEELKGEVIDHLLEKINELTDNKLNDWKKLNIGTSNKEDRYSFLDKRYMKDIPKGVKGTDETVRYAAMDFVFNSLIANGEAHKLFIGDPALYAKFMSNKDYVRILNNELVEKGEEPTKTLQNLTKEDLSNMLLVNLETTFINLGKRLAGDIAPGLELADSANNKYYQVFFNDKKLNSSNVNNSEQLEYFSRINKAYEGNYSGIEGADAQEYTTWKEHLYVLNKLGRLSTKQVEIFTKKLTSQSKNGVTDANKLEYADLELVLQPLKPVYVGNILSVDENVDKRLYIKSSSFPLIPQLSSGLELDKIRNEMEAFEKEMSTNTTQATVRASFGTATKVGAISNDNTLDVFDNNGNVVKDFKITKANSLLLPRSNFRIQQDVPYKRGKDSINIGTQERKLLFSNILDLEIEPGVTGEQLKEEYDTYYKELFQDSYEKLSERLGIANGGTIPIINLQKILVKEVKSATGYPLSMLQALALTEDGKEFKIPLWSSPYASKFESILTSIISNKVVKQKLPGGSYVLGSEEGFRVADGEGKNNPELAKSGIAFSPSFDPETGLKPLRWDPKTKKMLPAQVLLPWKFRGEDGDILDITKFTNEDGVLDFDKIPQKVLHLFGFRIPTQGHGSMAGVEIVGFLPETSGDLLIAPRDWVAQMGSDFDVDKLYSYAYNVHVTDGKLSTDFTKSKDILTEKISDIETDISFLQEELKIEKNDQEQLNELLEDNEDGEELNNFFTKFFDSISGSEEAKQELQDLYNKRSLLKRSYVAHRQNALLDIHMKIMTSSNDEIVNMNTDIDSFGEFEGLAARVFKDRKVNGDISERVTILSDVYQRTKFINATAGKNGVGSFSLDSSFNTMAQGKELIVLRLNEDGDKAMMKKPSHKQILLLNEVSEELARFATFGDIVSKGDISNKYTLRSQNIIANAKLSKRELTKEERESLKLKSTIIKSLQSTAVDNEKAQVLDKLNINNETFDAVRAMVMLGFEEIEISGLTTQPIIWEYIEAITNGRSSLAKFDEDLKGTVYNNLKIKYDGFNRLTKDSNLDHLRSQSGEELMNNLSSKLEVSNPKEMTTDFNIQQLLLIEKFQELSKVGEEIKSIQSAINTESKGLPTSLTENKYKVNQIDNLNNHKIYNAGKLLGKYNKVELIEPTTISGFAAVYGAKFANKIYAEHFPYWKEGVEIVNNEIKNHLPKGDDLSTHKQIEITNNIFKGIRSFVYNTTDVGLMTQDATIERARLFIDTDTNMSLANILKSEEHKNWFQSNGFLNKLSFDVNFDGKISRINYDSAVAESYDERNIYDSFAYLLKSNNLVGEFNGIEYTESMLAQELIMAAYLEGGIQGSKQYLKYIPIHYLNAMGFGDSLSNTNFNFKDGIFKGHLTEDGQAYYNDPSQFAKQFFQNNPDLVRTVNENDINKINVVKNDFDSFSIKPEKIEIYKRAIGTEIYPIKFLSIKVSRKEGGFKMFEYDETKGQYIKIPMLKGGYGFVQYNSQSKKVTNVEQPLIKSPTILINHPSHKLPAPSDKKTKVLKMLGVNPNESGNVAFKSLLKAITNEPDISTYHRELLLHLNSLTGNNSLKLEYFNGTSTQGRGTYSVKTNTLRLNLYSLDKMSANNIARLLAHETIHAYTSELIALYESKDINGRRNKLKKLTDEQLLLLSSLEDLQSQYLEDLFKKEGTEGINNWNTRFWTWKYMNIEKESYKASITLERYLKAFVPDFVEGVDYNPYIGTPEEKSKYYGGVKLAEFLTMALTDEGFMQSLNEIQSLNKNDASWYEKVKDIIVKLLKTLGLDVNPGSLLEATIKDTIALTKTYVKEDDAKPTKTSKVRPPINGVSAKALAEMSDKNYEELLRTGYVQWLDKDGDVQEAIIEPKVDAKYELFPGIYANKGQQEALDKLNEFLDSDKKAFLLQGKGGTGKTTIIKKIVENYNKGKVLGVGPTHKAKKVLQRSLGDDVKVVTLASALAIKLNEATGKFTPEQYARDNNNVPITRGDLIILDETSMVSDKLLAEIKEWKKAGAKIIFMGDKAQLPPVGQVTDSAVFNINNGYELTEKMRQAKNSPIIKLGTKVAANAESENRVANPIESLDRVNEKDATSGSTILWENSENKALDSFVADIKDSNGDVEYAKIITFNNQNHNSPQSVKNLNSKVRTKLFGEKALKEMFIPGEIITSYAQYSEDTGQDKDEVFFENSEDLIVKSVTSAKQATFTVGAYSRKQGHRSKKVTMDVEWLELQNEEGKMLPNPVPVISNSSKQAYRELLTELGNTDRQMMYKVLQTFANVEYGYAITSHKAQGSTYENVYVMEDNIMGPSNGGTIKAKNQSLYVAVSRPSNKLVMVSFKNPNTTVSKPLDTNRLSKSALRTNEPLSPEEGSDNDLISADDLAFQDAFEEFLLTCKK